jgi:hypothetical protein
MAQQTDAGSLSLRCVVSRDFHCSAEEKQKCIDLLVAIENALPYIKGRVNWLLEEKLQLGGCLVLDDGREVLINIWSTKKDYVQASVKIPMRNGLEFLFYYKLFNLPFRGYLFHKETVNTKLQKVHGKVLKEERRITEERENKLINHVLSANPDFFQSLRIF